MKVMCLKSAYSGIYIITNENKRISNWACVTFPNRTTKRNNLQNKGFYSFF